MSLGDPQTPQPSSADIVMAGRANFSKVEKQEEFSDLFGGQPVLKDVDGLRRLPTLDVFGAVFGDCDSQAAKTAYRDFFYRAKPVDINMADVPLPLAHIFRLLRHCKAKPQRRLFSNGAGKDFLASLFRLCHCFEFSKDWFIHFSTTGDSRTDWCRITPQRGQPNVSGVADVMIERDDGVKLVVGEVNLASSAGRKEGGPGEFQLLAELRMLQLSQPRQKVVGVLVNPSMMCIYMPNSARKSDFKYNYVTRDIRDLESVLDGLGIIFGYLTSNSVPPPIDAAPSLPQQLQRMFQEFSMDVTARLDEFSGRLDEFSGRLDAVEELEEARALPESLAN